MRVSPVELFCKVFHISSSLPESDRAWHIQLCLAYFTDLVKEIMDRMLTGSFQIPLLVNLDTNSNQSAAFKEVIESTSTDHKALEEEEDILNKNSRALLDSINRGPVLFTQGGLADEHATTSKLSSLPPQDQTENVYSQQSFQVEKMITKYKGNYGVKTNTDSKTGISYPHDKEYDFTSIFPVGFCGCFICRGEDHSNCND